MSQHDEIYERLAAHLSMTGMPLTDDLVEIVKQCFSPEQAKVALHLTPWPTPLTTQTIEQVSQHAGLESDRVETVLEQLVKKNLVFCTMQAGREKQYGFHHAGFGFPQSFFWDGKKSETAQKMTRLVVKYFNRDITAKAFGGTPTKPYRYIPVNQSVAPELQAVLPHDKMENVIENVERIAVAHCPCRVQAQLWNRGCDHPLEVCLKFDELAEYVIERKLGREISKPEARQIIEDCARAGLVHFVDNTAEKVKHNCNCCGCACWNVGNIKRRRIPRDELMAVYFIREDNFDNCVGCEACADICPVDAVSMEDGVATVDKDWCIGCGVCVQTCEVDAIHIRYREGAKTVPKDFGSLYDQIAEEREKSGKA